METIPGMYKPAVGTQVFWYTWTGVSYILDPALWKAKLKQVLFPLFVINYNNSLLPVVSNTPPYIACKVTDTVISG
jgi:hypothetical protein